MKKTCNIGITLLTSKKPMEEMLSSNGITQNVIFLYQLMEKLGHNVFFIGSKTEPADTIYISQTPYKTYTLQQVVDNKNPMDLLLEASVVLNKKTRDICRKLLGTKIVALNYGHEMIHDMERLFYPITADIAIRQGEPDAVWASPHFENSFGYLETLLQAPVFTCPYIWEPQFVDTPFTERDYQTQPNIQVMESNVSLMKNALIPITIAERICRENPAVFNQMCVNGSEQLVNNKYFKMNIVPNMPWLGKDRGKILFSNRRTFSQTFQHRDVLLSHQWGCELNYLYLEALYKNIPLVHNSPRLKNVGYFYEEFDVKGGKNACKKAIKDKNVSEYHKKGRQFLKQFSINNKSNQDGYQAIIDKSLTI